MKPDKDYLNYVIYGRDGNVHIVARQVLRDFVIDGKFDETLLPVLRHIAEEWHDQLGLDDGPDGAQ